MTDACLQAPPTLAGCRATLYPVPPRLPQFLGLGIRKGGHCCLALMGCGKPLVFGDIAPRVPNRTSARSTIILGPSSSWLFEAAALKIPLGDSGWKKPVSQAWWSRPVSPVLQKAKKRSSSWVMVAHTSALRRQRQAGLSVLRLA